MQRSEIDCNKSIGYKKKIIVKVEKIKRKENYFFREKWSGQSELSSFVILAALGQDEDHPPSCQLTGLTRLP